MNQGLEQARTLIREIPDYPIPGIRFQDLTPVLANPAALAAVIAALSPLAAESDLIAGIEARGFIFAAALAHSVNRGFIPIRKSGKLPYLTYGESYGLEYGSDTLEIHQDAIPSGARTLIIDDVLATGGTACASIKLVQRSGGVISSLATVLELPILGGRARISMENATLPVHALFTA
jgi:adenine phosphoribosyltransferase